MIREVHTCADPKEFVGWRAVEASFGASRQYVITGICAAFSHLRLTEVAWTRSSSVQIGRATRHR